MPGEIVDAKSEYDDIRVVFHSFYTKRLNLLKRVISSDTHAVDLRGLCTGIPIEFVLKNAGVQIVDIGHAIARRNRVAKHEYSARVRRLRQFKFMVPEPRGVNREIVHARVVRFHLRLITGKKLVPDNGVVREPEDLIVKGR